MVREECIISNIRGLEEKFIIKSMIYVLIALHFILWSYYPIFILFYAQDLKYLKAQILMT